MSRIVPDPIREIRVVRGLFLPPTVVHVYFIRLQSAIGNLQSAILYTFTGNFALHLALPKIRRAT